MSALEDALAQVKKIHDNQGALADPVTMTWQAEMAFKQAVVDAFTALQNVAPTEQQPDQSQTIATLQKQVAADQAAAEKIQAVIGDASGNVQAQAAGASSEVVEPAASSAAPAADLPPTIAPSTGGAA